MRVLAALLLLSSFAVPAKALDLLTLESVDVDASGDGWTTAREELVQATPEGNSATFSWSAPPATITSEGFTLALALEAKAAKDEMYPVIIYADGPFKFDPDPPQAHLYLNGDDGKAALSVSVKPRSDDLAGGLYVLTIGAAYGKAVHYNYRTIPHPVE